MILCLETATPSCSVALVHNGEVLACEEDPKGQNHSEKITLFISSVMKKANISYNDLDAIAVSMGPGSYTGLRIGVSTAKGLCYAVSKPLIAVETLESMAYGGKVVISTDAFSSAISTDAFSSVISTERSERRNLHH